MRASLGGCGLFKFGCGLFKFPGGLAVRRGAHEGLPGGVPVSASHHSVSPRRTTCGETRESRRRGSSRDGGEE